MTKAELISIGDEILLGSTINTNASWLGEKLTEIGIKVWQVTTISDSREHILNALREAENRADLIVITGGLGPTKDDITKDTLCEYFNTELVKDEEVLTRIEQYFKNRDRGMLESNIRQAFLPKGCTVIPNLHGTASGMWFEKNKKVFVSIPGVPYEMKAITENHLLRMFTSHFKTDVIVNKMVMTQGIGESFLAELISDWEDKLRNDGFGLAYLPNPGVVKLRISKSGDNRMEIENQIDSRIADLKKIVPEYIYAEEEKSIQAAIHEVLSTKSVTLATAESCTGGYLAHLITQNPGSSVYFKGAVVAYSNDIKISQLGVNPELIENHGAVSREVVEAMAVGVCSRLGADYGLATSGISGPDGGSEEKPVGTVWIAVATPQGVSSSLFHMGHHRGRNIEKSAKAALDMLRKSIV
jgi:nicotinamide-nucleotide amidase